MINVPAPGATRVLAAADRAAATLRREHPVIVGDRQAMFPQRVPQVVLTPIRSRPIINLAVSTDRLSGPGCHWGAACACPRRAWPEGTLPVVVLYHVRSTRNAAGVDTFAPTRHYMNQPDCPVGWFADAPVPVTICLMMLLPP